MNCNATRVLALLLAASTMNAAEFAVASIRPNTAGNFGKEGSERDKITISPTSLIMWNVTLQTCLRWAYDIRDYQITGPGWLTSEHYDISAKTSEDTDVPQMRRMLQRLLTERFRMSVHYEAKELPVYVMTVKRKDKLKPATGPGPGTARPVGGAFEFRNFSMAELADRLATRPFKVDRLVLDRTGLEGLYDFKVELAGDLIGLKHALEGIELGSPGAPSMLPILQDQLGLAFKSQKAPVDSLTIDHAEKVPSGN